MERIHYTTNPFAIVHMGADRLPKGTVFEGYALEYPHEGFFEMATILYDRLSRYHGHDKFAEETLIDGHNHRIIMPKRGYELLRKIERLPIQDLPDL